MALPSCPRECYTQVAYVTIAGRYVKGASLTDSSASWGQKLAGAGYQQASFTRALAVPREA